MKTLTVNTETQTLWRDYQVEILRLLFAGDKIGYTSGEVWAILQTRGFTLSRASVIFFLKALVEDGLVNDTQRTGKGGYHGVYSMILTREQFKAKIVKSIEDTILAVFPEPENTNFSVFPAVSSGLRH